MDDDDDDESFCIFMSISRKHSSVALFDDDAASLGAALLESSHSCSLVLQTVKVSALWGDSGHGEIKSRLIIEEWQELFLFHCTLSVIGAICVGHFLAGTTSSR